MPSLDKFIISTGVVDQVLQKNRRPLNVVDINCRTEQFRFCNIIQLICYPLEITRRGSMKEEIAGNREAFCICPKILMLGSYRRKALRTGSRYEYNGMTVQIIPRQNRQICPQMSGDDKISCVPPAFFQCLIQRDSSTDIRTKNDSSTPISIYFTLIQEKKLVDYIYRSTRLHRQGLQGGKVDVLQHGIGQSLQCSAPRDS